MGKKTADFMGAGMGTEMITGGLGLADGIYKAIDGGNKMREARREMEDYERQKFTNVADGMQVSTLGSDLERQEQARLSASQNQMLQDGGTRAMVGGLGKVQAGNQAVMAKTGAELDQKKKEIDMVRAEDQARIRTMQEEREKADLLALSSQYQSGKQDQNMGFGNIVQGAGMLGHGIGYANKPAPTGVQGQMNYNVNQGILNYPGAWNLGPQINTPYTQKQLETTATV